MYLMYIDEVYDRNDKYVVLTAFIVHDEDWKFFDDGINSIKNTYFGSTDFNLKFMRRYKEDEQKRWDSLNKIKKPNLQKKLGSILAHEKCTYMTALIDRHEMEKKNKEYWFKLAYGFLVQRFYYFVSAAGETGMVIMDNADSSQEVKALFKTHREILYKGIPYKAFSRRMRLNGKVIGITRDVRRHKKHSIIENLIFLDDNESNHLQIADLACSAVAQKFNRNRPQYFDKISSRFHNRGGELQGYGLKIFPKPK